MKLCKKAEYKHVYCPILIFQVLHVCTINTGRNIYAQRKDRTINVTSALDAWFMGD